MNWRRFAPFVVSSGLYLGIVAPASGTGLQPIGTSATVSIADLDYRIRVDGMFVSGRMDVTFVADEGRTNAANLRFPLPPGAVIHKAEVYLSAQGRWEVAETLGRRQGQGIHDDIVDDEPEVDPLLVQEIGLDLYRARVYPIDADGSLKIRIHYAHLLEPGDEGARLVVALQDGDTQTSTASETMHVTVDLVAGQWRGGAWDPVIAQDEPSVFVDVDAGVGRFAVDAFPLDEDLVLALDRKGPPAPVSSLAYRPSAASLDDHVFARWTAAFDEPAAATGSRNVVFVIDISGSMQGRKLAQTKAAIIRALERLDVGDRFGLVAFDDVAYRFDGRMHDRDDAAAARAWIEGLSAGSGTGLMGGLLAGLDTGASSDLEGQSVDLLVVTDGLPNVGESTAAGITNRLQDVARDRDLDVRVFGLGIGHDLDQSLLNGLTDSMRGEAVFALDDGAIGGHALALFDRCRGGGVADYEAGLDGGGVVFEPFTWSHVFADDPIDVGAVGTLTGAPVLSWTGRTTAGKLLAREVPSPAPAIGSDGVHLIAAALYANAVARELERNIDRFGETKERVIEALLLSRTYGIVTRYTSMLALETPELYEEYGIDKVERDPAGIALEAIELSDQDEDRIGGDGADDEAAEGDDDDWSPDDGLEDSAGFGGGCGCELGYGSKPVGWLALLGLLAIRRRGRTRPS